LKNLAARPHFRAHRIHPFWRLREVYNKYFNFLYIEISGIKKLIQKIMIKIYYYFLIFVGVGVDVGVNVDVGVGVNVG